MMRMSGGPYSAPIERWFIDGQWQNRPPKAPAAGYANTAQNLAAAIRTGEPLVCDGQQGRISRFVLDAMYESAQGSGAWVNIPDIAVAS